MAGQVAAVVVVIVVFGGFLATNHWSVAAAFDDLKRWSKVLSEWGARNVWES